MTPEAAWRRFWLELTRAPLALGIASVGLGIAALAGFDHDFVEALFLYAILPAAVAIGWMVRASWKAAALRAHLRQSLRLALIAHGDSENDVAIDDFPDIPLCLSRNWIYCAREKDLDVQRLDQMIWAYGESFRMRPGYQLVIWNRHAVANVLPVTKRHLGPALARLRQAAPWLPVGYNAAMKESWNADHRDFLALVDACREAGRPFDAAWAGHGLAEVSPRSRSPNSIESLVIQMHENEVARLMQRWETEAG